MLLFKEAAVEDGREKIQDYEKSHEQNLSLSSYDIEDLGWR